jgi:hypothetical protein
VLPDQQVRSHLYLVLPDRKEIKAIKGIKDQRGSPVHKDYKDYKDSEGLPDTLVTQAQILLLPVQLVLLVRLVILVTQALRE